MTYYCWKCGCTKESPTETCRTCATIKGFDDVTKTNLNNSIPYSYTPNFKPTLFERIIVWFSILIYCIPAGIGLYILYWLGNVLDGRG